MYISFEVPLWVVFLVMEAVLTNGHSEHHTREAQVSEKTAVSMAQTAERLPSLDSSLQPTVSVNKSFLATPLTHSYLL